MQVTHSKQRRATFLRMDPVWKTNSLQNKFKFNTATVLGITYFMYSNVFVVKKWKKHFI